MNDSSAMASWKLCPISGTGFLNRQSFKPMCLSCILHKQQLLTFHSSLIWSNILIPPIHQQAHDCLTAWPLKTDILTPLLDRLTSSHCRSMSAQTNRRWGTSLEGWPSHMPSKSSFPQSCVGVTIVQANKARQSSTWVTEGFTVDTQNLAWTCCVSNYRLVIA